MAASKQDCKDVLKVCSVLFVCLAGCRYLHPEMCFIGFRSL